MAYTGTRPDTSLFIIEISTIALYSPQLRINSSNISYLVSLSYQAATLTVPTDEIIRLLSSAGLERTLEILLVMRQSHNQIKNPEGFVRQAIKMGWVPTTLPKRLKQNDAHNVSGDLPPWVVKQNEEDKQQNELSEEQRQQAQELLRALGESS